MTIDAPPRRWRRKIGIALFAGAAFFLFWLFATWPPPLWYRYHFPKETAFMVMRRHENPSRAAKRKYQPVELRQLAPAIKRAVLIGEDHRFYEHTGLDYVEMRKALGYPRDSFSWFSTRDHRDMARAVRATFRRDKKTRGASTITQQLAKNLYLSPSRNPLRKVKEAVTAWRLELWLPKERILELYLNTVELGEEVWGIEAASRVYFGVPARAVSAQQAATLAAILPFPRSSNPYYRPGRMLWRRDFIYQRLMGRSIEIPIDEDTEPADSGR